MAEPGVGSDRAAMAWGPSAVAHLAATAPDRPAVVVADEVLTYGDLHRRSLHVGRALLARGEPGDRVLLRHDGLPELAVATLAVAQAGMVAVLVDPTDPEARVAALAELVGAIGLLTDLPWTPALGAEQVQAEGSAPDVPVGDGWALVAEPEPSALGSISFTSGSTGEPKGIMLPVEEQRSVGRVLALLDEHAGDERHVGLPFVGSTAGVDSGLHSMFQLGTTVHAFDVRRQGLHEIEAWLLETGVEAFSAVPTAFRFLLTLVAPDRVFPDLRLVVSFGETLPWDLVADLRVHLPADAAVVNVFGLTEARTVAGMVVHGHDPIGEGAVPAGAPLPGVEVAIVDPHGRPVPAGEVGEIVVTSTSCGLGYWGQPELSAHVFGVRPDGRRQVRTGDAGRLRADGVLEPIGRLDHVVKVAGNRVDLAEVEAAVLALPGVAHGAAVVVPDRHGELRLRAVVVPVPGTDPDPAELRRALAGQLSRWSVPDVVRVRRELPILATGKVDRRAVADQLVAEAGSEDATGADPVGADLEARLLALWRAELEQPQLGPDEDFFDAGGDSLRAARLFVEIEEQLGFDRPLSLLVHHRTVRSLAAVLSIDRDVWDVLVPLRTVGDRTPLIVVHGGHGEVIFAHELAALLPPDRPVYALRAAALDGYPPSATTLEEVAAGYVDDVRRVRPHGPYALYGHSLGGLIALEMARRFQADGEVVDLVALGDTAAPGVHPSSATRADRLVRHVRAARRRGPAPALALLRRQVTGLRRRFDRDAAHRDRERGTQRWAELAEASYPVPPHQRGDHVMYHYGLLAAAHRPTSRYSGRVVLLRADLSLADRGWDRWLAQEVAVEEVAGRHGWMGRQPGLGDVATHLRAHLALPVDGNGTVGAADG